MAEMFDGVVNTKRVLIIDECGECYFYYGDDGHKKCAFLPSATISMIEIHESCPLPEINEVLREGILAVEKKNELRKIFNVATFGCGDVNSGEVND